MSLVDDIIEDEGIEKPVLQDPKNGRFLPGNKGGGRPKGVLNQTKILKGELALTDWKTLKNWIENEGITQYIEELQALEGKDYIVAYLGILPYVKGKVANVEIKDDTGKIHSLDRTHSITIKDMRDGSTIEVVST